jgi:hypothetical protein
MSPEKIAERQIFDINLSNKSHQQFSSVFDLCVPTQVTLNAQAQPRLGINPEARLPFLLGYPAAAFAGGTLTASLP